MPRHEAIRRRAWVAESNYRCRTERTGESRAPERLQKGDLQKTVDLPAGAPHPNIRHTVTSPKLTTVTFWSQFEKRLQTTRSSFSQSAFNIWMRAYFLSSPATRTQGANSVLVCATMSLIAAL